jgi:predicted PhzF superfamily epimerase YddE/YHI9
MTTPLFIIDAFAAKPFGGNPAAVCLLDGDRDAGWMQALAIEMNLSETAYVRPVDGGFGLRWFTPALEVDLCGHATLASAHVLWESGRLPKDKPARFLSRSGWLIASRRGEEIEMDFPAKPAVQADPPPELAKALGAKLKWAGGNKMDWLVEVDSAAALHAIKPDFALLNTVPVRGVIVTSVSDKPEFDFLSRFFAPAAGVLEDPVTGSAHCCLAPYWSARLGKTEMVGFQASKRGGVVRVRIQGDRVMLGGRAVTIVRGELSSAVAQN